MATANTIHLAVIPDGNRRWAKTKGLLPWNGHERAIENFRKVLEWCRKDERIGVLTIWCFSTENWKRDQREVDELMKLFEQYLVDERDGFTREKTRFVHSGRKDRLPESLRKLIMDIEDETRGFSDFTLQLAIDYGGKDELLRTIRRLPDAAAVTEESLKEHLDQPTLPDIDLILRTSGEQRTSNFFLWQSTYAEWVFLKKHFPEIKTDDLDDAIKDFMKRTRRFGGS